MKIHAKHRSDISDFIRGACEASDLKRAYHLSEMDTWHLRNKLQDIGRTVAGMQAILAKAESAYTGQFFTNDNLHPPEKRYGMKEWSFTCDLYYDYPHVFFDCDDNHDVTSLLERERVVGKNDTSDPEMCCSYFYFTTKRNAEAFIARLNKFCQKRLNRRVA